MYEIKTINYNYYRISLVIVVSVLSLLFRNFLGTNTSNQATRQIFCIARSCKIRYRSTCLTGLYIFNKKKKLVKYPSQIHLFFYVLLCLGDFTSTPLSSLSLSFQEVWDEVRRMPPRHLSQWSGAQGAQQGVPSQLLHVHGVQQAAVHGRGTLCHRRK